MSTPTSFTFQFVWNLGNIHVRNSNRLQYGVGMHWVPYIYGDGELYLPEFFRQVTTGHNTEMIHAKYCGTPDSLVPWELQPTKTQQRLAPRTSYLDGWYDWTTVIAPSVSFSDISEEFYNGNREATFVEASSTRYLISYSQCKCNYTKKSNQTWYTIQYWELECDLQVPGKYQRHMWEKRFILPGCVMEATFIGAGEGEDRGYWSMYCDANLTLIVCNEDVASPQFFFNFGERQVASRVCNWPDTPYWPQVELAMQAAFVQAMRQVPKVTDNNISTLMDTIACVFSLLHGKFDIPRSWKQFLSPESLANLWLKYRYAYKTTQMDVQQALSYLEREMMTNLHSLHFNGSSECSANGVQATLRCSFDAKYKDDGAARLSNWAWRMGVEMNPYVLWDLIPFSFVVDWFTGTGDKLALTNDLKHYSQDYDVSNLCWSLKYQRTIGSDTAECYYRWYGGVPNLTGYTLEEDRISTRVASMRSMDAISLVVTKR